MLRNKRKRVAALLAGCMVIGSSMSVYAGTASGYVGKQRTHLNVTVRHAYASTGGNNAKTCSKKICDGWKYESNGCDADPNRSK